MSDMKTLHRELSVKCFNRTWDIIDRADRTAADNQEMLQLAYTSLWHWNQRDDCTDQQRSIGYWQVSRVHALAGHADAARAAAECCLQVSPEDQPFLQGFAHEALCRAESVAGNSEAAQQHLQLARSYADRITNADEQKMLRDDLDALAAM